MRNLISIFLVLSLFGCSSHNPGNGDEDFVWRLGWRMIENQMDDQLELAEMQFDSLLSIDHDIDPGFLKTGLELKSLSGKDDEVAEILIKQKDEVLRKLCMDEVLNRYEVCGSLAEKPVTHPDLSNRIMQLYFDDQASRGNIMEDIIERYDIDTLLYKSDSGMEIDLKNREQLKSIISEYGFPTRDMVGTKAMRGIFFVIQHADRDPEWQSAQLAIIEQAVKKGDMEGPDYAYLYDRVQKNAGKKQRYGTQFSDIDPVNKEVLLFETEDMESLDDRRREVGMMPIEMYKRIVLKAIAPSK